jgi:hypothetical protein
MEAKHEDDKLTLVEQKHPKPKTNQPLGQRELEIGRWMKILTSKVNLNPPQNPKTLRE